MVADIVILLLLLVGGVILTKTMGLEVLPRPPAGALDALRSQPILPLLVLATAVALSGWVSRLSYQGWDQLIDTAAGGPTIPEYTKCKSQLKQTRKCPYGGEVHKAPLRCTLHGEPLGASR